MKILHTVEFYSPSVGGAQEVIQQISERLAARGHQVTVATSYNKERKIRRLNNVEIEPFQISGNQARGFTGDIKRYQDFLRNGQFDIMMNYAAQEWTADLAFPILSELPFPAVLAPCGFSGLYNPLFVDYYQHIPEVLANYKHLIFHSNEYRDIQFVRKAGFTNHSVIYNGAGLNEFKVIDSTFRDRYNIPEDVPMFLTVGSHTGLKGHQLVLEAFSRAKIGRSVLIIIGNKVQDNWGCFPNCICQALWINMKRGEKKKVLLLNIPRKDVLAAYHAADLFVFCSNIECSPLVLFEAMASCTPFISLECGNAAEIVKIGGGGELMSTERQSSGYVQGDADNVASAIEGFFNNRGYFKKLGEAGLSAWKERFTWEKIVCDYENLYKNVIRSNS